MKKNSLIVTLLAALGTALLMLLGLWQCSRAHEKASLLSQSTKSNASIAQPWDIASKSPSPFQRIKIQGQFLNTNFLLDNQYHQHQWGYHVLTPFVSQGQMIFIDRGWIKGDPSRSVWPILKTPRGFIWVSGMVYYPSKKTFTLGNNEEHIDAHTVLIERLDLEKIKGPLLPFLLRLDPVFDFGYQRTWPVVSFPPERHYAYALQWFGMGFVLSIIWGYQMYKRHGKSLTLMGLALIFILPGLLALWFYRHPVTWKHTLNHGHLLTPPQYVGSEDPKHWQWGVWCNRPNSPRCVAAVDKLARIRLALGRHWYDITLRGNIQVSKNKAYIGLIDKRGYLIMTYPLTDPAQYIYEDIKTLL